MAVGLKALPELAPITGIRVAAGAAEIAKSGLAVEDTLAQIENTERILDSELGDPYVVRGVGVGSLDDLQASSHHREGRG